MSRQEQHASGDILQCPIVTSSTDIYYRPLDVYLYNNNFEQSRRFIRRLNRSFQHNSNPQFPMVSVPDNHSASNPISNPCCPTGSTRVAVISVICIFLCSLLAMSYVYTYFPELEPHEKQYIKIPFNIEDAKNLANVLGRYKERYFLEVLSGVCVVYIFLQTFAIPGSLFLSILSGFLFPFWLALLLVCSCSAIGASLCYLLSQLLGRRIVWSYFPERARAWSERVHRHKDDLFNYMLFLRITPLVPNWFINLTAPVIGVPLYPFLFGTFLGVAPPSFVAIQAGQTLHNMTSSNDAFSWTSIILLTLFAVISIIPVLLRNRMKEKFD